MTIWDRSGVVLEVVWDFDKYMVKVDCSGRVTMRNRQFLRHVHPTSDSSLCTGPR